jgi:ankyrin repeat protein
MNLGWLIAQSASTADVETVKQMLEQTPDLVHSHSPDGWTYLHRASELGRRDVAELLLTFGADVNARARNGLANTPLLCAVIGQHSDLVTLLLAHGADVNVRNTAGSTPLHKAAIGGNARLVRLLLAHGAQVDARNTGGQTPLVHALFLRHAEVAAVLEQYTATSEGERTQLSGRRT